MPLIPNTDPSTTPNSSGVGWWCWEAVLDVRHQSGTGKGGLAASGWGRKPLPDAAGRRIYLIVDVTAALRTSCACLPVAPSAFGSREPPFLGCAATHSVRLRLAAAAAAVALNGHLNLALLD
jgi:hypothetical protein